MIQLWLLNLDGTKSLICESSLAHLFYMIDLASECSFKDRLWIEEQDYRFAARIIQ